jgi:hypothetical protein
MPMRSVVTSGFGSVPGAVVAVACVEAAGVGEAVDVPPPHAAAMRPAPKVTARNTRG